MQNTMPQTKSKLKKTILLLDHNGELEKLVREPLLKQSEQSNFYPLLIIAKDGADASLKSANQKFDMVLIDMEAPRLMDGGFITGLHTFKNTLNAQIFVVSPNDSTNLPASLKSSKFFKKPVRADDFISALISSLNSQDSAPIAATPASKTSVDVRVVNAIITSTLRVLSELGLPSVKMEKASLKSPHDPLLGEVSSIIDITTNSFQGYLSISFDKESFLELISAMLMEEQTELTEENQDAVGEINNIIFGNAKPEITSYGVQLTVPRVVMGSNQVIPCVAGAAGMLVPFSTSKGKFYLTIVAQPKVKAA